MKTTGKHCSTPQEVFDFANRVWGPFDVDIAAEAWNAKCPKFVTKEMNALGCCGIVSGPYENPWVGRVWCNPPWDNIEEFIRAAQLELCDGDATIVVMLLPARAGRSWWRDVERAGYMPIGRPKFGTKDGQPGKGGYEDCVLVAFTPPYKRGRE